MMVPDELRQLYPDLSDSDLAVAMENLDRYLLLAWEIFEEPSTAEKIDSGEDDR